MRKAVLAAAILIGVWLVLWLGSLLFRSSIRTSSAQSWPLELGTLNEVPQRYPTTTMSPGAARLIELAEPLGINIAPISPENPPGPRPMEFVRGQLWGWAEEQLAEPTPEIHALPSEAGEYLAGRAADLAAIQKLLLSGQPITWVEDLENELRPMPNLGAQFQLHRVMVARALDRARVGDRGAWDDLRAIWNLARSLMRRHEMISNMVALAMTRNVLAAARKMPLPPPAWLEEIGALDIRRALLAAAQAGAFHMNDRVYIETTVDSSPLAQRAVDAVMAPYTRMAAADIARAWRSVAIEVASTRNCSLDLEALRESTAWWNVPARHLVMPNLEETWRRLALFTPEREATFRALALRAGAPPQPESECADGRWIYGKDGRSFRFTNPAVAIEFSLDAGQ